MGGGGSVYRISVHNIVKRIRLLQWHNTGFVLGADGQFLKILYKEISSAPKSICFVVYCGIFFFKLITFERDLTSETAAGIASCCVKLSAMNFTNQKSVV